MDYKAYALMAILMASVASVALVGAAYAQSAALTVQTDKNSYTSGEDITITGQVESAASQIILIQVLDPQGNRDRIDQVQVAADGSFTYTFRAGGLMNTDGTYRVVVGSGSRTAETTFQFTAGEQWRTINVNIGGENHQIQYMITGAGNRLDRITGDVTTKSFLAELTAQSAGTLSLRFNESIFDADSEFTAFVDEVAFDKPLPAGPGATNTLRIDFDAGTSQIEIIGDRIIPEFGAIAAIVLAVAIVGIIVATARYGKFNFTPRL